MSTFENFFNNYISAELEMQDNSNNSSGDEKSFESIFNKVFFESKHIKMENEFREDLKFREIIKSKKESDIFTNKLSITEEIYEDKENKENYSEKEDLEDNYYDYIKEEKIDEKEEKNQIFKRAKKISNKMSAIVEESKSEMKTIRKTIPETEKNVKHSRKFKPDDIRKKVKAHFFKTLRLRFNSILKEFSTHKKIESLHQNFIVNISKEFNSIYFNYSYKQLLETDFSNNTDDYKRFKNISTLKYLNKNYPEEDSIINYILNKKIYSIFEEYLLSQDFFDNLEKIKRKEKPFYLKKYIHYALKFISFIDQSL